jgi:hypothetical protein
MILFPFAAFKGGCRNRLFTAIYSDIFIISSFSLFVFSTLHF